MKWLLALSLILNGVMAFLLLRPTPAPVERLIIETHGPVAPKVYETRAHEVAPMPQKSEEKKAEKPSQTASLIDEKTFDELSEKVESDRTEFLTQELGLSLETIEKGQSLKAQYQRAMGKFFEKSEEPSFDERRKMIALEEKLHNDLRDLFGPKKWERYQRYRDKYNKASHRRTSDNENMPLMYMGL